MTIKAIACIDEAFGLGYKNELLCKLPADLKRFRRLTTGKGNNTVLCGSKTYESMGNLPNRTMAVASRTKQYKDVHATKDAHDFIRLWKEYSRDGDLFVIGGGELYKETLQYVDELYITVIHHEFKNVDSWFPELNDDEWEVIYEEYNQKDDKNPYDYTYRTLKRIKRN